MSLRVAAVIAAAMILLPAFAMADKHGGRSDAVNPAIIKATQGAARPDADKARDKYRHPVDSLSFWGLRPGMTIVEISPGPGSWWTKILAPFAKDTKGRYIAGYVDMAAPNLTDAGRKARADFLAEYADAAKFGAVEVTDFGMTSGLRLPDNSADFILVARAFHNWSRAPGVTARYMSEFSRVLKPGGVLAVEQHRAPAGADVAVTAPNGYVPEAYVISAAGAAGLALAGKSEINANPKDTKDHPFGVWTLPPTRRSAPQGEPANPNFDHTKYDAIGESDRMTLRFVKGR
ncbi:MAG TPA: methyltransferase [Alphaproteobacteria bacterium]|nr:methyltransferase [Alphaproteobacteria bacterium]